MKHDKIMYDKTEIIVVDETGKRPALLNLTYDKITSIAFDKCKEGLFGKPSEKISITVRGKEKPLVYYKGKEKEKFDRYKEMLTKFAKDNKVSFYNNL
ncbi:MAG TPA: hypothetical protein IAC91_04210 [Candidatus Faecimorpha stercoravium]|nr:hypothetical protein [Candidatus Faecimorpha stercoravium]